MTLDSIEVVERINDDTWKVKAVYAEEEDGADDDIEDDGEEETVSFAFDTGGGTMHRNQSLKTVSKAPNDAPDFNGAIEVDNEGNVNGVDVTMPVLNFTETHTMSGTRVTTSYKKNIAALTGVNKGTDVIRKEGYIPPLPNGVCELGDMIFIEGNENKVVYEPSQTDIERVKHSIKEASMCSDYVILSIHSHQLFEDDKTAVPEFLQALSHLFIDFGADAIIGHGPHLLRPIEVYKDKPIFYSLGDFVIQLYDVPIAPEEFYKKYGLTSDSSVIELLEKRSAGFTRGLMEDVRMLESVIPYWETDADKKLTKLVLKPIKASKGDKKSIEGLPQPTNDLAFIDHLAKMCEPYGVKITIKDGLAVCEW
jgi:poly-gamma-glutamate synthesis protein (capsule biosynthesis protein)